MADRDLTKSSIARAALAQYEDALLGYPNVTGVGIQDKLLPDGSLEPVVQVYVSQKLPPEDLADEDLLPTELEVTVIDETGNQDRQERIGVQVEPMSELKF
jgi:hypothetical protein